MGQPRFVVGNVGKLAVQRTNSLIHYYVLKLKSKTYDKSTTNRT